MINRINTAKYPLVITHAVIKVLWTDEKGTNILASENRPDLRPTLLSPARNNLPAGYTFAGLPKMFVDYGDTEVFAPGIQRFVEAVKNSGVQLELNEAQDKVHCYSYNARDGIASGLYGKLSSFVDIDQEI